MFMPGSIVMSLFNLDLLYWWAVPEEERAISWRDGMIAEVGQPENEERRIITGMRNGKRM